MNAFLVGVSIGLTLVGLAGFAFGAVFLIYFLAKYNIFFTIVEEGSAKAIMRGGEFHHFVLAYKGYIFSKNKGKEWDLVLSKKNEKSLSFLPKPFGERFKKIFGGIRWIGIPFLNTIYEYNFRWTVLRESKPSDEEDGFAGKRELDNGKWALSLAKRIDYIYLRDAVYYNDLVGAETDELMPVNISMLLPMRVKNPYKALFRVQKWLDATLDLIKPSVRQAVAQMLYKQVIQKKEVAEWEFDAFLRLTETQKDELMKDAQWKRKEKPRSISEYILDTYGVQVKRVTFEDIVPPKAYSEAAAQRMVAEQEAEQAKAEQKRIEILALAEANRMETVYRKVEGFGETGLAVRMFEAISQGSDKQGNWVIPFGSVRSLLKGVLGNKKEGE